MSITTIIKPKLLKRSDYITTFKPLLVHPKLSTVSCLDKAVHLNDAFILSKIGFLGVLYIPICTYIFSVY